MSKKIKISSGAKWEEIVGYSRALITGNRILISGTTSIEDGKITGKGDAYVQTKTILKKIEKVLTDSGFKLEDVIRTRIYVTDISKWKEVGKAHGEFFKSIKPVTSMVEIKSLIDKKMLVEIEAEAVA